MSFRRILSFAALTAIVAVGSAQAGDAPHAFTGNSVTANNIAAGFKNKADQSVSANQMGAYKPWGGSTANSIGATNLATGFKNRASQDVWAQQGGGRMPTYNSVDALNLSAGGHNAATQRLMTHQR